MAGNALRNEQEVGMQRKREAANEGLSFAAETPQPVRPILSREARDLEPYVSADAVAAHLSVRRRVVLNLARSGRIPAHPLDPNADKKIWRFKLSEIDAVLNRNQLGSRQDTRDNIGQVLGGPEKARKERFRWHSSGQ
jgi:hypothetical protein